jgi:hypothetical protein
VQTLLAKPAWRPAAATMPPRLSSMALA